MSIDSAVSFIDKIKNDANLQGELLKAASGVLGGGSGGGGLNLGAILNGGAGGGSAAGGDLWQIAIDFAKSKGFAFIKEELQKALGGADLAGLLGGGGLEKMLGGLGGLGGLSGLGAPRKS